MYVEDVFLPIIGHDNEYGLNLNRYRIQSLVCKEWRQLAIKSIQILNIDELIPKSKFTKLSLISQLICDPILTSFPRLTHLQLNFPMNRLTALANQINNRYVKYDEFSKESVYNYLDDKYKNIEKNYFNNPSITNGINCLVKHWVYSGLESMFNKVQFSFNEIHVKIIKLFKSLKLKNLHTNYHMEELFHIQNLYLQGDNIIPNIDSNIESLILNGRIMYIENLLKFKNLHTLGLFLIDIPKDSLYQFFNQIDQLNLKQLQLIDSYRINEDIIYDGIAKTKIHTLKLNSCLLTKQNLNKLTNIKELELSNIIKDNRFDPTLLGNFNEDDLIEFTQNNPHIKIIKM